MNHKTESPNIETSISQQRRRARIMRLVNVPMRQVLQLPVQTPISRRLMLLHLTGRKSGRAYRQPVSYVVNGDTLLSPGGGNWKHNLRDGEPIWVRLRGRDWRARPEFIRDPSEVERLLRTMMRSNPRMTSFVPFIGTDGRIDQASLLVAVAHGFCIIRWHLDTLIAGDRAPLVSARSRPTYRGRTSLSVVAAVMISLAVSLAVASGLHLSGMTKGRSAPFNPTQAGIAEAVIGAVLLAAAILMHRRTDSARLIGIAGAGFAIVGFLVGLMFTTLGGHWPDIAYHLTVLPVLLVIVLILGRSDREGRSTPTNSQELLS